MASKLTVSVIGLFLIGIVLFSSCSQKTSLAERGFVHAVYFYLEQDLSGEQISFFEEGMKKLAQAPSISKTIYGPPAMTPRKLVDNTYDYAFIVFFENKTAHDAYQVHPLHDQFRKEIEGIVKDVKIYDSVYGK